MPYLHCPSCHRAAWLRQAAGPGARCRRCDTRLTAVLSGGSDALLTAAVRARFARDARHEGGHRRFVRDSGPHRLAE